MCKRCIALFFGALAMMSGCDSHQESAGESPDAQLTKLSLQPTELSFRTVVLTGQPAPGTDEGFTFRNFIHPPVINEKGQVAFTANIEESSNSGEGVVRAFFSEGSGKLEFVARKIPGLSSNLPPDEVGLRDTFSTENPMALSDTGQVDFVGVKASKPGVYLATSTGVQPVAVAGEPAPGTKVVFGYKFDGLVMNQSGHVAFEGDLSGAGVESANHIGIFSTRSGKLELVARVGDPISTQGDGTVLKRSIREPLMLSAGGQVTFLAELGGTNASTIDHKQGIFLDRSGELMLVASTGTKLPDNDGNEVFKHLFRPIGNRAGQIVFRANVGTPGRKDGRRGIFTNGSGPLKSIALVGDPVPGVGQGVKFKSLDGLMLNDKGHTIFTAVLEGEAVDATNNVGVFSNRMGRLEAIVRTGIAIDGESQPMIFHEIGEKYAVNANGDLLFYGSFTAGSRRGYGLFLLTEKRQLIPITHKGDIFELSQGDSRKIKSILIIGIPWQQGCLNSEGQLALQLNFTDGSEGIFVATYK